MTLHNTVRKIDCKSLLHTAYSYFLPIDKPLPMFCKDKNSQQKSTLCQLSHIESSAMPLLNFSLDFFLPLSNSASLDRFGNSFVSDVDIIAYNNENLPGTFLFFISPQAYLVLFSPRQIILSVRVCVHMLQRQLPC